MVTNIKEKSAQEQLDAGRSKNTTHEEFLSIALNGKPLAQFAVTSNLAAPAEALNILATNTNVSIKAKALAHPNISKGLIVESLKGEKISDRELTAIISNPQFKLSELETLFSQRESFSAHRGLALNPNSSPEILAKILEKYAYGDVEDYNNLMIIDAGLKHANIPLKFLEYFAVTGTEEHRMNVAKHPQTPSYILEKLSSDESENVQQCIFLNPNTTLFKAADYFAEHLDNLQDIGYSIEQLELRLDNELKTLGYDNLTLESLPLQMKLDIFASTRKVV